MASDTIWMSESQDIEHPHPVVNKFRAWRTLTRWLLEGIPIYDLCDEHTYTTPLMRGLSYSVRHYVPALRPLPREKRRGRRNASRAMTYWLEDVEASGIDLMEYGKLEHEMRYRIAISEDHGTSSCDDAWWLSEPQPVLRSFEPESENWSIWWEPSAYQFAGEFWYTIENPYLRMPGAWLADSYDEPDSHFSYDEEHGWDSLHVRELHFPVEKLAKALDPTDIHKALSTDHEVQKKDSALVSESTDPGRISSGPSRQEPYHGTESESQTIVDKRKASKTLRKEGEKATYASGNGLYRLSTWAQITINVVSQAHKHEITRKHFSSEIWRLVHDSDLIIEDNHQNLLGVLVSLWVYLAVVDSSMIAKTICTATIELQNTYVKDAKESLHPSPKSASTPELSRPARQKILCAETSSVGSRKSEYDHVHHGRQMRGALSVRDGKTIFEFSLTYLTMISQLLITTLTWLSSNAKKHSMNTFVMKSCPCSGLISRRR
ncbi:hypothetical protein CGCF415_v005273 [Colletotrichum fructicola]|nr:hypothetical protein CGCF415_v005273 [Colletotrichum fructicola]KAF4939844.1 hypothetical protein CGCF245_v003198 [Colletotrichum fructicola]